MDIGVPLLVALGGSVVIAWIAAILLDGAIGNRYRIHQGDRAKYKWLAFRVTMQLSGVLAASIYGFTNAADIIDAIARIIHP